MDLVFNKNKENDSFLGAFGTVLKEVGNAIMNGIRNLYHATGLNKIFDGFSKNYDDMRSHIENNKFGNDLNKLGHSMKGTVTGLYSEAKREVDNLFRAPPQQNETTQNIHKISVMNLEKINEQAQNSYNKLEEKIENKFKFNP